MADYASKEEPDDPQQNTEQQSVENLAQEFFHFFNLSSILSQKPMLASPNTQRANQDDLDAPITSMKKIASNIKKKSTAPTPTQRLSTMVFTFGFLFVDPLLPGPGGPKVPVFPRGQHGFVRRQYFGLCAR